MSSSRIARDPPPDLIITGGTVVNATASARADVAVRGGIISAVGQRGTLGPATVEVDATGKLVVPGGVDAHVHANDQVGDFRTRDSFFECSVAALSGGTTTLVDFAMPPMPGGSPWEAAQSRVTAAESSAIDFALHAGISSANPDCLADVARLIQAGITTFKIFTIYDDVALPLADIEPVLEAIADVGGLALIHAEAPGLISDRQQRLAARGLTSATWHAVSRPPRSELEMVQAVLLALGSTRCAAYFVHISTPEAVEAISAARDRGARVWTETCPHYVFLNDDVYRSSYPELYTCSPPIRGRSRRDLLWQLLVAGEIQLWSSDHCAYSRAQKAARPEFWGIPQGLPGVETRCPLLFSEAVVRAGMPAEQFVALTATNPARLNGLYPRKGRIAVGTDADIAIWDPHGPPATVSARRLHTAADHSPFEGFETVGELSMVIRNGLVVASAGRLDPPPPGSGRFVPAGRPQPPRVLHAAGIDRGSYMDRSI